MSNPFILSTPEQNQKVQIRDIAWMIHWVGIAMLGFFLAALPFQLWPVALLKPAWLTKLVASLMGAGLLPVLGALLLSAAPVLEPMSDDLSKRANLVRRLATWAAIGYLLLIPVQLYAGLKQSRELIENQTQSLNQAKRAVAAIRKSTNLAELEQAYNQVPGNKPQFGSDEKLTIPLEQFRDQLADRLEPNINRAEEKFSTGLNSAWQSWIARVFRDTLMLLMLSMGFAAIGRKSPSRPTLLMSAFATKPLRRGHPPQAVHF